MNSSAHTTAGNDLSRYGYRWHDFQGNIGRLAKLAERLNVTRAIVAEEKVRTFDHCPGRELLSNNAVEELFRRKREERFVGGICDDRGDTQISEQLSLAIRPGQRWRSRFGPEQTHGVRIERENDSRAVQFTSLG